MYSRDLEANKTEFSFHMVIKILTAEINISGDEQSESEVPY
jgi:hypothetical protein